MQWDPPWGISILADFSLWGISFHAVVVFGLGKILLFKFLGHCAVHSRGTALLVRYSFLKLKPSAEGKCRKLSVNCRLCTSFFFVLQVFQRYVLAMTFAITYYILFKACSWLWENLCPANEYYLQTLCYYYRCQQRCCVRWCSTQLLAKCRLISHKPQLGQILS